MPTNQKHPKTSKNHHQTWTHQAVEGSDRCANHSGSPRQSVVPQVSWLAIWLCDEKPLVRHSAML